MFHSIRTKLVTFLLLAAILPMISSILISYHYTKNAVKDQTIRENRRLLIQGEENIKNTLDIYNRLTLSIYTDAQFRQKSLYKIIEDGADDLAAEQEITQFLNRIYSSSDNIHQVYLYVYRSKMGYLMFNDQLRKSAAPTAPPFEVRNAPYEAYIVPPHMSAAYNIGPYVYYVSERVISFRRPIYRVPEDDIMAVVSVDVKLNPVRSIGQQLHEGEQADVYILNRDGEVFYSSGQGKARLNEAKWLDHIRKESRIAGFFDWESTTFSGIILYRKMENAYLDWMMVKQIPYDTLYSGARRIARINSGVLIGFLLVSAMATLWISFRLTRPLRRLTKAIQKIETGQTRVDIPVEGRDEIGTLAFRFRHMIQTLNNLVLREYQLELNNKTNQLKALQAQINPHFMNNALQSIGTLALRSRQTQIYALITSLANMMRYHMNTEEPLVPLSKEFNHVEAYFSLQKQRFREQLQIELTAEEATRDIRVPKMVLQPIVENFFKHGFQRDRKTDSCISVDSRVIQGQILQIVVEDNGTGIEPGKLARIRQELSARESAWTPRSHSNIGLKNVLARLRLYFGERSALTLDHSVPHGTKVTIHIPLKEAMLLHENHDRR